MQFQNKLKSAGMLFKDVKTGQCKLSEFVIPLSTALGYPNSSSVKKELIYTFI